MSTPPPSGPEDPAPEPASSSSLGDEPVLKESDWPGPGSGRKKRFRLPIPELTKIGMMITCLVLIIVMRHACAQGVVNLFNVMAPTPPAATADAGVGADGRP